MTKARGFLISAPSSGTGKTTVTLGLLRAFRDRGNAVQPYKSGPDYIDPAFHRFASGRASYNLDTWAMGAGVLQGVIETSTDADMVIAEGSMGLFDGVATRGASGYGASAETARRMGWPVVLVLDVSGQAQSAAATALGVQAGYREINLNVGCPSDRVQSGCFGAVLMKTPQLVADCVRAMQDAATVEVTVKCRIGVDEQEPRDILPVFLEKIRTAGCQRVTIHARKAWLKGLSPKENRDIPPLDYELVHEMKRAFGDMHISLNGGIASLDAALEHLDRGLDGVMVGRAAYHQPSDILAAADARVYGVGAARDPFDVVQQMLPYIEEQMAQGARLHQISRHMLGLFAGRPGARAWRRALSEGAVRDGAGPEVMLKALDHVAPLAEV